MKIGFTGLELPEGKTKYKDDVLLALETKDKAKKVSPFFAEFVLDEFIQVEAIVVLKSNILDLLINDMEKIETRIKNTTDDTEKTLMQKCLENLENEIPLCDVEFSEPEQEILNAIAPPSLKPVIQVDGTEDINTIISLALDKANYMFFYTSGPTESHAWLVKKGSDIITCAGKIHTDLARGFIKGDVVSYEDYMSCHNFNDCKSKGVAKLVDKDYIVAPNEIIEIRFNV
jgi:ribosome-binding ATPase